MATQKEAEQTAQGVGNARQLHVDEIALKKGYGQFETILYTEQEVLDTMCGKRSVDLQALLKQIPGIGQITQVSMDMCAAFADAVRAALPWAEIVIDRFHLFKLLHKTLDKLRVKLAKAQPKRFSHIRFVLFKDEKDLSRDDRRLVKDYLRLNPQVKPIYDLCQQLRAIVFGSNKNRKEVSNALLAWCDKARQYLPKFVKTLNSWWDEVVNACIYPLSNGRAEGINNQIKLIKRKGFGFRNRQNFKLRVKATCNP